MQRDLREPQEKPELDSALYSMLIPSVCRTSHREQASTPKRLSAWDSPTIYNSNGFRTTTYVWFETASEASQGTAGPQFGPRNSPGYTDLRETRTMILNELQSNVLEIGIQEVFWKPIHDASLIIIKWWQRLSLKNSCGARTMPSRLSLYILVRCMNEQVLACSNNILHMIFPPGNWILQRVQDNVKLNL